MLSRIALESSSLFLFLVLSLSTQTMLYKLILSDESYYISDAECERNCTSSGCDSSFFADRCQRQEPNDRYGGYKECLRSELDLNGDIRSCSKAWSPAWGIPPTAGPCYKYCPEIAKRITKVLLEPTTKEITTPTTTVLTTTTERRVLSDVEISILSLGLVFLVIIVIVITDIQIICCCCKKKKSLSNEKEDNTELNTLKPESQGLLEHQQNDQNEEICNVQPQTEASLKPIHEIPSFLTPKVNLPTREEADRNADEQSRKLENPNLGNGFNPKSSSATTNGSSPISMDERDHIAKNSDGGTSDDTLKPDKDDGQPSTSGLRSEPADVDESQTVESIKPPGLPNPDEKKCYQNSVMQALAPVADVVIEWLSGGQSQPSKDVRDWISQLEFLRDPIMNNRPKMDLVTLHNKLGWREHLLRSGSSNTEGQQDAHEFFSWILNRLRSTIHGSSVQQPTNSTPDQHELLADIFDSLNLGVSREDNREYCQLEELIKSQHASISMGRACLCVYLDRGYCENSKQMKNKTRVAYPMTLEIAPTSSSSNAPIIKYQLKSVINHIGEDITSGHYITYRRYLSQGWFRSNDQAVHEVSEETVLDPSNTNLHAGKNEQSQREDACMLFYSRQA